MQYNIRNIQAWHVFLGFLACRFITWLSAHTNQPLDIFSWVSCMSFYHITIRAQGPATWHVFLGFLTCRFITWLSGHTDQPLDMFFLGFSHVALSHHYQGTRTSSLTCFSWVSRMSLYHMTIRAHGPAAWHVFLGFLACPFITSLSAHMDQQLDMFFLGFSHLPLSHDYQRTRTSSLTCFSWVSRMSLYHMTIRAQGPATWHVFLGFLSCHFLRYIRRLSVV